MAIPSLTRELGAATSDIQWMINAYSLVQSGLLLTAGSAADRYGRKKMLATGLALFGLGSLAAGLAESHRPADRGTGRDGRRRRAADDHHARRGHADLRARGAAEGHRHLGAVSSLGFAAGPLIGGVRC